MLLQLKEGEFLEEEQEDETFLENNIMRRLFRILVLPTPDIFNEEEEAGSFVNKKAGIKSVLHKSLYNNSSRIRDCLLSIANISQECSISSFCESQKDFK
jgi:hypothetical protein